MHEVKRLLNGSDGTPKPGCNNDRNKQSRQKLETAKRLLDRIVSIRSTDPMALHYYALYHMDVGRFDLAEEKLTRAARLVPSNPMPQHNLGDLYFKKKAYVKATSHYKRAIQIDPNLDLPYVGLGNIKFLQGRIYSAMGAYSRAVRLNQHNADALIGLGNCYKKNNNTDKAFGCYEQAYQLNKTSKGLNAALSEMFIAKKQYHEADEILTNAIDLYPASSLFHKQLGDVKSAMGNEDGAVEAYTNFLRLTCENEILTKFIKSKFESYLSIAILSDLLKKQKKINYDLLIKDLNNTLIIYLIRKQVLGKPTTAKKKAIQQFSTYFTDKVVVSSSTKKNGAPQKQTCMPW
jgi:tetratricopeptide (TPR) repeat protein